MNAFYQKIELKDSLGNPVQGIVSIPAAAEIVVIMSHGFTSNMKSGLYLEFEKIFNRLGIGTVRYEYFGHGPLYGHIGGYAVSDNVTLTKTVSSLKAVINYLKEMEQVNIVLLGASFGGLVSLIGAAEEETVKLLVLKSPVTDPTGFWRQRLGDDGIRDWEDTGMMHSDHDIVEYYLTSEYLFDARTYDTLQMARNIHCPTLIIHGEKDTCVPIEQSERLAAVLGTKVHVIKGAEHSYTEPEQQKEMKNLIIEFVSSWAQNV